MITLIKKLESSTSFLAKRLKEPSTQASLSVLLVLTGSHINASILSDIVNVIAILFGVAGVFTAEKG